MSGLLGNYFRGWMGGKIAKTFGGDERLGQLAALASDRDGDERPQQGEWAFSALLTPVERFTEHSTLYSFAFTHWSFWLSGLGMIWGWFAFLVWVSANGAIYQVRSCNLFFFLLMLGYGIYRALVEFGADPRPRQVVLPVVGGLALTSLYLILMGLSYWSALMVESAPWRDPPYYPKASLSRFVGFCAPGLVTGTPLGVLNVFGLSDEAGWDPGVEGWDAITWHQELEAARADSTRNGQYYDEYWERVRKGTLTEEDRAINEALSEGGVEAWEKYKNHPRVKNFIATQEGYIAARKAKEPWWYLE